MPVGDHFLRRGKVLPVVEMKSGFYQNLDTHLKMGDDVYCDISNGLVVVKVWHTHLKMREGILPSSASNEQRKTALIASDCEFISEIISIPDRLQLKQFLQPLKPSQCCKCFDKEV
ncbi:hypothetical protein D918_07676 [Trichuris suis]|nr:hypothetical protein D918_07676 [Trichuris suis]